LIRGPLAIGLVHATISTYQVTGNHESPDYSNLDFERQYSDRLLAIAPLDPDESRALAAELLGRGPATEADAIAIARESGGNPFFVHELVRYIQAGFSPGERLASEGPVMLDCVLRARVQRLPEGARRLLEVIAVSGRPLVLADALQTAKLGPGDGRALALLRTSRLLRGTGTADRDEVETYHDRVREAVVSHLDTETLRAYHGRLARVLEATGKADPEVLAAHYRGAGEHDRAAGYYAAAADQAADALAFDRAATLYRLALELGSAGVPDGRQLRTRLGDALVNAGRGAEAAHEYLASVEGAGSAEQLVLRRRAAEQFLRSGYIDDGLGVLGDLLGLVDMRLAQTPRRALLALLLRRAWIRLRGVRFRERDASQLPPSEIAKLDICWSVAVGLTMVDTIHGSDFQARHLLLALKAGEPYRIALGLGLEAGHRAIPGGRSRREAEQIWRMATALAERIGHPHALGLTTMMAGAASWLVGSWEKTRESSEQAERILRGRCKGVAWELDSARVFSLAALVWLGRWREHADHLQPLLKEAQDRGDLYAQTSLYLLGYSYIHALRADDPDLSVHELDRTLGRWSQVGFHLQHFWALFGKVETALYRGEGRLALGLLEGRWNDLARSLLLRIQTIRLFAWHLRARCTLAAISGGETGTRAPQAGARLLRKAQRYGRRIARERMPWSDPLGRLVDAGVLANQGRFGDALAYLAAAESGLEAADMALYAAAARWRRGQLIGGDEGRHLVESAESRMSDQGIRNPRRITDMYAAGFPPCRSRWTAPRP
jgi:hypothetical protein